MRTEALIGALTADAAANKPRRLTPVFWTAVAVGTLCAAAAFALTIGPRADVVTALASVRYVFKFVVTIALAIGAAAFLRRLTRPAATSGPGALALWAAPILLALGVAVELIVMPSAEWSERVIGHNALLCMAMIPLLAALPLGALLWALRGAAPASPAAMGAVAGLLAAAIAATFYAAHCRDDSPLFVAVWYPIGIAIVTSAGAALGARLLRW